MSNKIKELIKDIISDILGVVLMGVSIILFVKGVIDWIPATVIFIAGCVLFFIPDEKIGQIVERIVNKKLGNDRKE